MSVTTIVAVKVCMGLERDGVSGVGAVVRNQDEILPSNVRRNREAALVNDTSSRCHSTLVPLHVGDLDGRDQDLSVSVGVHDVQKDLLTNSVSLLPERRTRDRRVCHDFFLYARAEVIAPVAKERVSPEAVVFGTVSEPNSCRIGVPAESQTSIPLMVVAGMLVTVTAPDEADEPVAAVAIVRVGAPVPEVYPPEVASSVPFAVTEPTAVMKRHLSGPTVAVSVVFPWMASRIWFARALGMDMDQAPFVR